MSRSAHCVLLLSLWSTVASPQTWTPVGPPGGDVRALAADPSDPGVVYLGTANGSLYRSQDAGLHWRRLSPGFPLVGMSLDGVLVDARGDVIVGYWEVAGTGGGVARSSDGGESFTLLPDIAGESVRSLAISPSEPEVLVAGALSGVFRTQDGGLSWSRISPDGHVGLRNVGSVAVDPTDPEIVYAGTWHLPWKTTDGGQSWKRIHAGMISDSDVMALSVGPRDREHLYASACSGIYRSRNGGRRWARVQGIPWASRRTRAFTHDPEHPDRLFAGTTQGLWVSEDGASTWRLATERQLVANTLVALPGGIVLAGTDATGVLRSSDRGRSWTPANEGFSERFVSRVSFDPASGRVVVATVGPRHHSGVLTAAVPEGPWSPWAPGLEGRHVLSLAVVEAGVLAGTDDGIFVSSQLGDPWRRLPTLVGGTDAHPRVHDLAALEGGTLIAATPEGLLRGSDEGSSWELRQLGSAARVSALASSDAHGSTVVAATPLGVYRSRDVGRSWEAVSRSPGGYSIESLVFLPGDGQVLLASTSRGLLWTLDLGRTWSRPGTGLPARAFTGLAWHPDGRRLYASDFTVGGLYQSEDGGKTWRALATDGLGSTRVWALALDPKRPERLLASAASGGLHVLSLETVTSGQEDPRSTTSGGEDR